MKITTNSNNRQKTGSVLSTRSLAIMAMLAGMSVILMLFEIPLWFAPPFYELDFSEVPVLIGAFALGPVAGVIIELLKILLNLVITGTQTAGVGELGNFLIGCSLVLPATIIYYRKKTFKTAVIGLMVGSICMVILGNFMNAFILLPAYAYFFNMPIEALIAMGTRVNPAIDNLSTFIFLAVTPFNLLKGVAVSLITLLLYKRVSSGIKSIMEL